MMQTRGTISSDKNEKIVLENKVFFMKNEIIDSENESAEIISLRNPASNQLSYYIVAKNKIFEIIEYNEPKRCWFINQTVCSNNKLYLVSPIDPLFLLLPYVFKECQNHLIPLDQIINDTEFEEAIKLLTLIPKTQFQYIGDVKELQNLIVLKYNEEKCLKWLEKKCCNLVKVLKLKNIQVGLNAVSSTYVKSTKLQDVEEIEYIKYAHGMISEYLSTELAEKLQNHLKLSEDNTQTKKRKSLIEFESKASIKKIKIQEADIDSPFNLSDNILIKKEKIKENKTNPKTKALAKSALGTKNISSFFTKK